MRFAACVIAVLSLCRFGVAQNSSANEWTWQGGNAIDFSICQWPTFCAQAGVYGTQGVFASANYPGNRSGFASATDNQGRLWLYGGYGIDGSGSWGYLADLWAFDPATKEWEWVSGSNARSPNQAAGQWGQLGVPASSNTPGTRNMAGSWIDSQGNFWLFGGYAVDSGGNGGRLNDLWKYDVTTNQWTWAAGSNLMTMCGSPYPNETVCLQPGSLGQLGVPGPGNTPGGRVGEVTWTDNSGNLWLIGGLGVDANGTPGNLNDLWNFNPSTNQWAWMSGSGNIVCLNPGPFSCLGSQDPPAQYGTIGVSAPGNVPAGKTNALGWKDASGNFWLFGGSGKIGTFNDVWEYVPSSNEWTWMAGNAITTGTPTSFPGVYGTLAVAASTNTPGSRSQAVGWKDQAGNLWVFGGAGNDSTNTFGYLNDLWAFNPSTKKWAWMGGTPMLGGDCGPPDFCQRAKYGTLGTPGSSTPGSLFGAAGWTDLNGNLWLFGGTLPAFAIPSDNLWEYQPAANTLPPAVTPIFLPTAGTYTLTQNVTMTNGMSNATIYYTTDGSTPTTNSSVYTAPVSVSNSQTIKAIAVAGGYPNSGVASAVYVIQPPAATPTFSQPSGTYNGAQSVSITDSTPQATIYFTTDGTAPTTNSSPYSGAITVSTSETLQAIAVAPGYSASAVMSAQYTIADFSLSTVNPASVTVTHGQTGHATVTLNAVNSFSSTVSFACSGLPAGATCSFNPATVTPSGTSVSTTINIATSGMSARKRYQQQFLLAAGFFAICVVGLGAPLKHRRRLLSFLCVANVLMLVACGGGGSSSNFTPITSTVTVTASAGSLQHSASFTLTVR